MALASLVSLALTVLVAPVATLFLPAPDQVAPPAPRGFALAGFAALMPLKKSSDSKQVVFAVFVRTH